MSKKQFIKCASYLLILVLLAGIFVTAPRVSSAEPALSQGQQNIVKRARQMTGIQWTPRKDIIGWGSGLTYRAGVTYTGLPYGQPVNTSYVPWTTSLEGFLAAVNNPNSLMYTSYSSFNKRAPYYSIDCSAFVSWAWGLSKRQTTATIANFATAISSSSYVNAQVGDCLNKANSHVVLITDIDYDASGNIVCIEISESTVVAATNYCCQVVRYGKGGAYDLNYFVNKYFGDGYTLYRSKTRDSVTYTHSCAVPLEGDTCAECGVGGYVAECTTYPCAVKLEITEDCCPYTQPCNPTTASESGYTSEKLTGKPISRGEILTADALYQNTEGNYWYRVTLSDGTKAYLYSTHTQMDAMVKPWVEGGGFPASISGTTYLQGTVTAGGGRLDKVQAYVCPGDSSSPVLESNSVTVNANTYPLYNSTVDKTLVFGDLEQYGTADYTLRIMTDFTSYYADDNTLSTTGLCGYAAGSYSFRFVANTSHTCDQSTFVDYEAAHPHYARYRCSVCGTVSRKLSETNQDNTCDQCRPGKPILQISVDGYGTATFTWSATANTTHYNVWLLQKDGDGNWNVIERFYEAVSGFTHTLGVGEYCAQLLSYNSEMWEPDGSDWAHTRANDVFFSVSECDHSYSTVIDQAPTCTTAGLQTSTCTKCGYSRSETIPPAGHSYYERVTQPTCTESGYTTHTCTVCGSSYRDSYTDPAGHSYEDGYCTDCGAENPDAVMTGDLNGDGTVTSADAVLLARYLVDLAELTEVQLRAADVNHDGTVSSADSVLLARFLAGVIGEI